MPFDGALIDSSRLKNERITKSRSNQLRRKRQSGPGDASHDGHGGVAGNIEWCPRLELMRRGEHVRILDPAWRNERARGQQNIDSPESLIDRRYHLAPAFLRPKVVIG
jgi:hypothetical protein